MNVPLDAKAARFDESLLIDLVGNDATTLRGLFDLYLTSCARSIDDVEAALRGADLDAVFASAHRLKAASHQVGALALSRVAATIETLARSQHPDALQTLQPLVLRCRAEADAAQQWILAQRARLPAC